MQLIHGECAILMSALMTLLKIPSATLVLMNTLALQYNGFSQSRELREGRSAYLNFKPVHFPSSFSILSRRNLILFDFFYSNL